MQDSEHLEWSMAADDHKEAIAEVKSLLFFFFSLGGIPAKHKDENLLIFLGIIDILQSYRWAAAQYQEICLLAYKSESKSESD